MKPHVSFAVVGLGDWGVAVAEALADIAGADLRALCDADVDVVRRLRPRFPGVAVTASFEELLRDTPVDAVVVATPLSHRRGVARLATVAGRHVFLRTPPSATSEELERLAVLAAANRRLLVVGDLHLEQPALRRLMAMAESGDLGNLLFVQAESERARGTASPDILLELGVKPLTAVLAFVREDPVAISGYAHTAPGMQSPDLVGCHLRFESGIVADVRISDIGYRELQRVTLVGSERTATYDSVHRTVTIHERPDSGEYPAARIGPDAGTELRLHFRETPPLLSELDSFVAAVRGDGDVIAEARRMARSRHVIDVLRAVVDGPSIGESGARAGSGQGIPAASATHSYGRVALDDRLYPHLLGAERLPAREGRLDRL